MRLKVLFSIAVVALGVVAPNEMAQAQTPTDYKWLSNYDSDNVLKDRIAPPVGFSRKACETSSFCNWLRNVPLKPQGSKVHYYNGDVKHHAQHYAVIDLDTGSRDLQQCADAVMRLKAEYHYSKRDYANIHFNYTSGHKVSFDDWRKGRKPIVKGNKVSFSGAGDQTDNSYRNFRRYMTQIFSYAGSLSLSKELKAVNFSQIHVGDVFIVGGLPGHAVMVMDVVENDEGDKRFLLAQSYMPAQDMHILINPMSEDKSPWYTTDIQTALYTPEWTFDLDDLKRFKN